MKLRYNVYCCKREGVTLWKCRTLYWMAGAAGSAVHCIGWLVRLRGGVEGSQLQPTPRFLSTTLLRRASSTHLQQGRGHGVQLLRGQGGLRAQGGRGEMQVTQSSQGEVTGGKASQRTPKASHKLSA